MKPRILFLLVGLSLGVVFGLNAQSSKNLPPKKIGNIVGTWKISKINSGSNEVAKNPTSGQWIEFRSDGKYVNQALSLDSGSYRMDENNSTLFLESSVHSNEKTDSPKEIREWAISINNETMTMEQRKATQDHADKMKYFYVRIADAKASLK